MPLELAAQGWPVAKSLFVPAKDQPKKLALPAGASKIRLLRTSGARERFLGIIIEHFAGKFPVWLAPVQARIIPIGEAHHEKAREIFNTMKDADIRAEIDLSPDNFGKKVRSAKTENIPYFIDCKHGRQVAKYDHPRLEPILKGTYGVFVYQEQVMRIINRLGGIELSKAYACIKAISKKKAEIIEKKNVALAIVVGAMAIAIGLIVAAVSLSGVATEISFLVARLAKHSLLAALVLVMLASIVLGTAETTLLRLANAYGMIVNGGKKLTPSLIERIDDRHGKTIYRRDSRDCSGCQLTSLDNLADDAARGAVQKSQPSNSLQKKTLTRYLLRNTCMDHGFGNTY